jgi:hypothetical protein
MLLFGSQLAVGGRRRMNRQRTGVAHVGQMAEKLEPLNELLARRRSAFDPKTENGTRAFGEVPFCPLMIGVAGARDT